MPRRGLRFDVDDDESDNASSSHKHGEDKVLEQRPMARLPSAGLPPIHRAPSLKLHQQSQQQQQQQQQSMDKEEEGDASGEQGLPDGITAIQVVDPADPNSVVLQVSYGIPICIQLDKAVNITGIKMY